MRAELNNKRTSIMNYYETKPSTNIEVKLTYVTPSIASNYLRFNDKNRKPSNEHVLFLAKQMKEGLFMENGESIVFDSNGILNDGQHRLLAIVKSGESYWIPVVRGVKPKSMATYDTGRNRSASDVLHLNGFSYSSQISALIKSIDKFSFRKAKHSRVNGTSRYESLTNQQVLDYCSVNYDWLKDIAREVSAINKRSKLSVLAISSLGLIAYIIGGEKPSSEVYSFLKNLIGVSVEEGTATSYLYTKLYNAKINKEPLNFYWVLGMSIKAWNYYCDGNPSVKYFKFSVEQELPTINKQ